MNTTSTGRISLLKAAPALLLSLLLCACGGGSDDSPETSNLTVTFTNISEPSQLEGISVVLHGADNRSIEQVLQPDSNGVVDFGQVDRSRVSFSVIEVFSPEGVPEDREPFLEIYTIMDAPNMPYFREARFGDHPMNNYVYPYCADEDRVQLLGRIINAPENTHAIGIAGAAGDFVRINLPSEDETFPIDVCAEALDVDNYYLIAHGFSDTSYFSEVIAHSSKVYLDAETNIYVFDLSQTPVTIPITSNIGPELIVDGAYLEDSLLNRPSGTHFNNSESITVLDLDEEPYWFFASNYDSDSESYFSFNRVMSQLPETLTFDPPAFSLRNRVQINEEARSVSWDLQNASSVDAISVYMGSVFRSGRWTIKLPPDTPSLTLPDLPEEIERKLYFDDSTDFTSLALEDYGNSSGYESLLNDFNDLNRAEDWYDVYKNLGEVTRVIYSNPLSDF
jgi:hypothetical protein